MNIAEAARYATFFIEFQPSLNLSKSFSKVPILSVYDFRLNYMKSQQSGHFGSCGTGTTLFGTGTIHILYGGTGTTCIGTGTDWVLLGGTGTTSWFCPELLIFPSFGTIFLHTTSPFHITSKTNMEFIQKPLHNTCIGGLGTSHNQTLGENPRTLTQVHQFIQPIKF